MVEAAVGQKSAQKRELVNQSEFAVVESVVGEFLLEVDQDGAGFLGAVFAKGGDGKHHAGKRG